MPIATRLAENALGGLCMTLLRRCIIPAGGLLLMVLIICPFEVVAQVSLDIHVGSPPPYRFAAPPDVTVIPGTYVYAVPDVGVGIFFYSGGWYRSYEGRWFRGRSYDGPWVHCPDHRIPRALVELPPDYRRMPPGHHRIPYGQLKKNWAAWERDRYWEKDRGPQDGRHGRTEDRQEAKRERFEDNHEKEHGHGRD
jgi:hypothetical protein